MHIRGKLFFSVVCGHWVALWFFPLRFPGFISLRQKWHGTSGTYGIGQWGNNRMATKEIFLLKCEALWEQQSTNGKSLALVTLISNDQTERKCEWCGLLLTKEDPRVRHCNRSHAQQNRRLRG